MKTCIIALVLFSLLALGCGVHDVHSLGLP